jgi:hypothetical protein
VLEPYETARKSALGALLRMIAFVPIGLLGIVALVLAVSLTAIPPLYAIIVFINGRYVLAVCVLALWLVWLRLGLASSCG